MGGPAGMYFDYKARRWVPIPGAAPRSWGWVRAGSPEDLAMQFDVQNEIARRTNIGRYWQILQGTPFADQGYTPAPDIPSYMSRYRSAMAELEKLGEAERSRINRGFDTEQARALAELRARGLGDSTETAAITGRYAAYRSEALRDLEERLARQRIDVGSRLSGDVLSFMERRTDAPPDTSGYLQMMYMLGRTGGGGGGYGYTSRLLPLYGGRYMNRPKHADRLRMYAGIE